MRFRGGGVGHMSTRAATDVFKHDRDILDTDLRQARQDQYAHGPPNVEEDSEGDSDLDDIYMDTEGSGAGEARVDEDNNSDVSESELDDYGYELNDEDLDEDLEEEDIYGEEHDMTIDELGALGYGEY